MGGQDENRYRMATGGIFQCKYDERWTVIHANDSLYHFLGYTKEEFQTLFHSEMAGVIYPDDLLPMAETVAEQLKEGTVVINENRLICKDGSVKWIWISCEYVEDPQTGPYFYCMFHDITRQKEAREIMEMSERRYEIVLSQTQDVIFDWNCLTSEIYYSPTYEVKFGYKPAEGDFPQCVIDAGLVHPDDMELFRVHFDKIVKGADQEVVEYRKKKADGKYLWCRISTTAIRNSEGKLLKAIGMISDIDEQKKQMMSARELAIRDPLTGLYNRKETEELVNDYVAGHQETAAFLVIDIDNFKGVNDTLGHVYGDAVLGDIARSMKSLCRTTDILGRIGGDEFVAFLPGIKSRENAVRKVEELREIFHRSFQAIGLRYDITCSIGVSFYPKDGCRYRELFEHADLAMYHAKKNGKNQYAVFSQNIKSVQKGLQEYGCKEAEVHIPQKNFRDNLLEYSFRIFYDNHDINKAIPILLELVGTIFNVSRVYILEEEECGKYVINTFEWCDRNIIPLQRDQLKFTMAELTKMLQFDEQNIYHCSNIKEVEEENVRLWLESRGTVSALLYKIEEEDKTAAIIGFEDSGGSRGADGEARGMLVLIAQTISLFLESARKQERLYKQRKFLADILGNINAGVYGISPDTYELIFYNKSSRYQIPGLELGTTCYESIRGNTEPCSDCPVKELSKNENYVLKELYHAKTKRWSETSASLQHWIDGREIWLISCYDITNNRADAARIDFLMRMIPGGMNGCYVEKGLPLQFINDQLLHLIGYDDREEFYRDNGDRFANMIDPRDRERVETEIWKSLETSGEYAVIYRLLKKDGTYLWVYNKGRETVTEDGRRTFLSLCLDATGTKELENQLDLYRSASQGGTFMVRIDDDFTLLYGNDIYYQVHEYTKEEMMERIGNRCREYVYPQDLDNVRNAISQAWENGEPSVEWEMRVITGKGNIRWIRSRGTFEYCDGELRMNGFVENSTEKHRLMEQLSHSEQRYRIALNQTKFNVWECDIKEHCLRLTESSEYLHGFSKVVERVPESLIEVGHIHPESHEIFRDMYRRLYAGERHVEADIKTRTSDGKGWWWERIIYTTIDDEWGNPSYAIAIGEDITKQKEAEFRYQQELQMRNGLTEGLLMSYRMNITQNKVESLEEADGKSVKREAQSYDSFVESRIQSLANPGDQERFRIIFSSDALARSYESGQVNLSLEYRMREENGKLIWVLETLRLLRDSFNGDLYAYGNTRNITEQKMMELSLRQRAQKDSLTGAYDRETAFKMMKNALSQSIRDKFQCALLVFRVDGFTRMIHEHGYAAVEHVMEETGQLLQQKFTGNRIVGRMYEDEFAVLLKDQIELPFLEKTIAEIGEGIQLASIFGYENEAINISAGIVYSSEKTRTLRELYTQARMALSQSSMKETQYVVYNDTMESGELSEMDMPDFEIPKDDSSRTLLLKCAFMLAAAAKIEKTIVRALKMAAEYYGASHICLMEVNVESQEPLHIYEWTQAGKERPCYESKKLEEVCEQVTIVMSEEKLIGYLGLGSFKKNANRREVFHELPYLLGNRLLQNQMGRKQEYLGYHDALTGLLNRNSYIEYCTGILEETLMSLGVVSVDINGLKKANTEYGHNYGDHVVKMIAKAMQTYFADGRVYRFAGDEFLAVNENLTRDAFMTSVEQFKIFAAANYIYGVSVGSVWNDIDIRLENMVSHADERMVLEKQEYYRNSTIKTKRKDPKLVRNLCIALENRYFEVYLQPKADLSTGLVTGAEALIRCNHPSQGIIYPDKFIPLLESQGIIHYIDFFVFEEVCRILEQWKNQGVTDYSISLNFSRATLLGENLIDRMEAIFEKYSVNKEQIVIEITESMGEVERETLALLGQKIQNNGYRLSLDDFGAKYSNLSILSLIRFDELKLDKSLVNDLFSNRNTEIIIKNCLNTCRELGIKSVAEGVETKEQYDILKKLECDFVQGYYYNKPLPRPAFEKLYVKEFK